MPTSALWDIPQIPRRFGNLPVHQSGNDTTISVDHTQISTIHVIAVLAMKILDTLDDDAAIGRIVGAQAQHQRGEYRTETIYDWAGRT